MQLRRGVSKMSKTKKALLAWREKQKPGAIMRSSTFERIVRETMSKYKLSRERAEKVAGKAYWTTVRAKYRERRKSPVAEAIKRRGNA